MNTNVIKTENQDRPATKRQLWALFSASRKCGVKHDYRNDNLTMLQASELLQKFNAQRVVGVVGVNNIPTKSVSKTTKSVSKKNSLEQEFIDYMSTKISDVIATTRKALQLKSVVEDDPKFFPNKKDRQKFAFFGFGCGISIIEYDKRSKVGKQIEELSQKHKFTTFLKMFLKGFSAKEIKYMESQGFPLSAMYAQDYQIGRTYMSAVMSFMKMKGVKNLNVRTFDD